MGKVLDSRGSGSSLALAAGGSSVRLVELSVSYSCSTIATVESSAAVVVSSSSIELKAEGAVLASIKKRPKELKSKPKNSGLKVIREKRQDGSSELGKTSGKMKRSFAEMPPSFWQG